VKWHDKTDWAFDDVWEKRRVYVVEGTSKLPQYAYSKRVIFIDKEVWLIPYSDIYDRAGELWKIWINSFTMRKKAIDGAIEYPDEMAFDSAIVMVDMQLEHATRAATPSHRFPGEQGWYFNQGEKAGTPDDWFSVAALVAAGHWRPAPAAAVSSGPSCSARCSRRARGAPSRRPTCRGSAPGTPRRRAGWCRGSSTRPSGTRPRPRPR